MKYQFKVGELVKVNHTGDLGLVTARSVSHGDGAHRLQQAIKLPAYAILIGGNLVHVLEHELRKVGE